MSTVVKWLHVLGSNEVMTMGFIYRAVGSAEPLMLILLPLTLQLVQDIDIDHRCLLRRLLYREND